MAINFDQIPNEKPNVSLEGLVQLEIAEMTLTTTKTAPPRPALNIKFATDAGISVFETLIDDEKSAFLMYKLGRFLRAANINLQGASFTLNELMKILKRGTRVWAMLAKNDKGYAAISYKNEHKGFYTADEAAQLKLELDSGTLAAQSAEAAADAAAASLDVQNSAPKIDPAIDLSVSTDDDSY